MSFTSKSVIKSCDPWSLSADTFFVLKLTQTVYIVEDIASKCEISHPLT